MPKGGLTDLPENFEARIATSETRIDSVSSDVSKLAGAVDKLARTVNEGFQQLHERITAQQRTNWPTIFAGFTVFAVLFGVYLQAPIQSLSRHDEQISRLERRDSEREYHRGRADEARETLKAEVDRHAATFRELMTLNAAATGLHSDQAARIKALEEKKP